jgi:hypothetical protein
MKKALCVVMLVMASTCVAVPAAQAGQPCVSSREFRQVHKGMAQARVHRIFDTPGHRNAHSGNIEVRGYRPCASLRAVSVTYSRDRVQTKRKISR